MFSLIWTETRSVHFSRHSIPELFGCDQTQKSKDLDQMGVGEESAGLMSL